MGSVPMNHKVHRECSGAARNACLALGRLVLLAFLAAGCSGEKKDGTKATAPGKVVIKGSNTIGEELAPRLITEYKKNHAAASFDLESKATGYGLAALMAGQCDIAAASRP